jgi:hypothetical protein
MARRRAPPLRRPIHFSYGAAASRLTASTNASPPRCPVDRSQAVSAGPRLTTKFKSTAASLPRRLPIASVLRSAQLTELPTAMGSGYPERFRPSAPRRPSTGMRSTYHCEATTRLSARNHVVATRSSGRATAASSLDRTVAIALLANRCRPLTSGGSHCASDSRECVPILPAAPLARHPSRPWCHPRVPALAKDRDRRRDRSANATAARASSFEARNRQIARSPDPVAVGPHRGFIGMYARDSVSCGVRFARRAAGVAMFFLHSLFTRRRLSSRCAGCAIADVDIGHPLLPASARFVTRRRAGPNRVAAP